MRTEQFTGDMRNWWSTPLTKLKLKDGTLNTEAVLNFAGEYEAFGPDKDPATYVDADWEAAIVEMREKNEFPTAQEIVTLRNDKRKGNARQKAMAAQVAAAGLVQPTTENEPQLRLKRAFELTLQGYTPEERQKPEVIQEVRDAVSTLLKIAWEK